MMPRHVIAPRTIRGPPDDRKSVSGSPADPWADPRDDASLVEAVSDRDWAALRVVFDYGPWLYLMLSRRCAGAGIVEEAVQDTFVAAFMNLTPKPMFKVEEADKADVPMTFSATK